MNPESLSSEQLDALQEIGNIGVGNAATALSQLINERIDLKVPRVCVVPFSRLADYTADRGAFVAGIYLEITGEIPGELLFVMPYREAKQLAGLIIGQQSGQAELGEMEISALMEAGNIICGNFLNALGALTSLEFKYSVPSFCGDIFEAILGSILYNIGQFGDCALMMETEFRCRADKLGGSFFYLPHEDSLDAILNAVGVSR